MSESELERRFTALRGESEALAPELRLPAARLTARRVTPRQLAAGALLAAGLAALVVLGLRSGPPPASEPWLTSGAWATPSDALLAPVAFDLAHSVPDFSAPRPTSTSGRNTP
jgi:hypothetical protein